MVYSILTGRCSLAERIDKWKIVVPQLSGVTGIEMYWWVCAVIENFHSTKMLEYSTWRRGCAKVWWLNNTCFRRFSWIKLCMGGRAIVGLPGRLRWCMDAQGSIRVEFWATVYRDILEHGSVIEFIRKFVNAKCTISEQCKCVNTFVREWAFAWHELGSMCGFAD